MIIKIDLSRVTPCSLVDTYTYNPFRQRYCLIVGDSGSTVVKVLCYKSEGRWFDPS